MLVYEEIKRENWSTLKIREPFGTEKLYLVSISGIADQGYMQICIQNRMHYLIGHIRILTVVLETSMKERLMRGNHFKCKLFPPHEPPSHARSSPTVRIRIRSIDFPFSITKREGHFGSYVRLSY